MAKLIKIGAQIRNEEEKLWDDLVEQIWAGNVIPVIGDNLVVPETTIMKAIVEYLATEKGIKKVPQSFSELYYEKDFEKHQPDVYEEVSELIKINQAYFEPTDILKEFLSIEQFPFVITTSVDYTVEEIMREVWMKRGRKLKTLVFSNDTTKNDDIKRDTDILNPTIYYMFGKADKAREHSFVLTEEDMLTFCQAWLSEGRHPSTLSKVLGNKYLLFFGVNYPDWLIRFMWFSMRNNLRDSGMLIDAREFESSLVNFFQRVSIYTQSTPNCVIEEIKKRLAIKQMEYEKRKFDYIPQKMDYFISYSRRDKVWAEKLYNALTNMGYKVWYDKNNIAVGADWELEVRSGIRTAKRFIALISENVANESEEHHPYRTEWEIALGHRLTDKEFLIPIALKKEEIYQDNRLNLPSDLKFINALHWAEVNGVDSIMNKLVIN